MVLSNKKIILMIRPNLHTQEKNDGFFWAGGISLILGSQFNLTNEYTYQFLSNYDSRFHSDKRLKNLK